MLVAGYLGKLVGGELGRGLLCNGLGLGLPSWGVAGSGFITGSKGASCLAGGGGGEVGEGGGRGKAGRQGAGLLDPDDDEEGGTPGPADDDEGPPGEGAALEGPLAREPVLEVSLRPSARLRVSQTGPVLLQGKARIIGAENMRSFHFKLWDVYLDFILILSFPSSWTNCPGNPHKSDIRACSKRRFPPN